MDRKLNSGGLGDRKKMITQTSQDAKVGRASPPCPLSTGEGEGLVGAGNPGLKPGATSSLPRWGCGMRTQAFGSEPALSEKAPYVE